MNLSDELKRHQVDGEINKVIQDMSDFIDSQCDHSQADYKKIQHEVPNIDRPDSVWLETIIECPCGAWRYPDEEWWNE